MACYVEEEAWKCPKHASQRRRNGICPTCLLDRLVSLCPHCANLRPCACVVLTALSWSSSSSSSSSGGASNDPPGERSFNRSRSVAMPFLHSQEWRTDAEHRPSLDAVVSEKEQEEEKRDAGEGEATRSRSVTAHGCVGISTC